MANQLPEDPQQSQYVGGQVSPIPASHPEITVVIPAYNAEVTIASQLDALCSQLDAPPFSIIVVNNGSTDSTVNIVESFRGNEIPIRVVNQPKRGVNLARNTGIDNASRGVILLCDADDVVCRTWVKSLSSVVSEEVWGNGPCHWIVADTTERLDRKNVSRSSYAVRTEREPDPTMGCNCGFHKVMWDRLGGFDSRLSGLGDETEFFTRARRLGFSSMITNEAEVLYRKRPLPSVVHSIDIAFRRGIHDHFVSLCEGGQWIQEQSVVFGLVLVIRSVLAGIKHGWNSSGRRHWIESISYRLGRVASPILLKWPFFSVVSRSNGQVGLLVRRWATEVV